uniref:Uncharacterized protein n=1 Tax=Candidatus Kentrum sp. LPFa TaxID=2126335 RepID=A0A450WT85_9GAMM|nr:MAG: hypothetical protein BECKLPF1236B_GA0070989_12032 [Candidatus Kentron sp. LPFa]
MICQHRFRIEQFDVGFYTACPDLAFPIESTIEPGRNRLARLRLGSMNHNPAPVKEPLKLDPIVKLGGK